MVMERLVLKKLVPATMTNTTSAGMRSWASRIPSKMVLRRENLVLMMNRETYKEEGSWSFSFFTYKT